MTYLANITRSKGDPKVISSGPSSLTGPDRLARALGWFSFGLGLAEIIAPHQLTRALGIQGRESLVRAFGAREIASGVMTLSTETQLGLWARLAGDGLDLVTLAAANKSTNPKQSNVALAMMMVGGVAALDLIGASSVASRHAKSVGRRRSYRHRSGFPQGLEHARGAARKLREGGQAGRPLMTESQSAMRDRQLQNS